MHKRLNDWFDFGKFETLILFLNCLPDKTRDNIKYQLFYKNEGNMRKIMILIFCVFAIGLLITDGWSQEIKNKDKFGRLILQIIDPDTGAPVNEEFAIFFYSLNESYYDHRLVHFATDEKGLLFMDYYSTYVGVLIGPTSETSKYCRFFHPGRENMPEEYKKLFSFRLTIEIGKVTRINKKAIIGGSLKVKLVDLAGNLVNAATSFPWQKVEIEISVKNNRLYDLPVKYGRLETGEVLLNGLFPDSSYEIELSSIGMGYGKLTKSNIEIKKKEITEVVFVIDVNDNTGVEGIILNKLGMPSKNANIILHSAELLNNGSRNRIETLADDNGYYKLTGLKEGKYEILVFPDESNSYPTDSILIEIKKNILLRKDFNLH